MAEFSVKPSVPYIETVTSPHHQIFEKLRHKANFYVTSPVETTFQRKLRKIHTIHPTHQRNFLRVFLYLSTTRISLWDGAGLGLLGGDLWVCGEGAAHGLGGPE